MCYFIDKTSVYCANLLFCGELFKCKVEYHKYAEDYPVPAEHLEIVLFNIAHKELDNEYRDNECCYHADSEYSELSAREVETEFHELQQACTEHYRHSEEESEFCGTGYCLTRGSMV